MAADMINNIVRSGRAWLAVVVLSSVTLPRTVQAAPAAYCDDYWVTPVEWCSLSCACWTPPPSSQLVACNGVRAYEWYCDGRRRATYPCYCDSGALYAWDSDLWSAASLCQSLLASDPPPPEICGNSVDENCDGITAPACTSEECGNGIDDDGDGLEDEGCSVPEPPGPEAPPVLSEVDPISEMNDGCRNGDWAGSDPVHLPTRSATTEPFTDFEVEPLRRLALTRTYSSLGAGHSLGGVVGIFGRGWHHNWETSLTCSGNGANCTVGGGLAPAMNFSAVSGTVTGVGALAGEALKLYRRTEAANLAHEGHNLMVRRPNGEFVLFDVNGGEQRFSRSTCTGSACMDSNFNGTLPLARDIDAGGRSVTLEYGTTNLLTATDDLGNRLTVEASSVCPERAGALKYRSGSGGAESTYVTYVYNVYCVLLWKVLPDPASYVAAPGHEAQLRRYQYDYGYDSLLTEVHNEFDDPVVMFTYDGTSGRVNSLIDSESSLSFTYPQPTQDTMTAAFGPSQSTSVTRYRGAGGKAFAEARDQQYDASRPHSFWRERYLKCTELQGRTLTRFFERDPYNRVVMVHDYNGPASAGGYGTPHPSCADTSPPAGAVVLRKTFYEYGLARTVAVGISMPLNVPTKIQRYSVLQEELAAAGVTDTLVSTTYDYDASAKSGDPSGYTCSSTALPVGGRVCRVTVSGYALKVDGTPELQRFTTFFSYDSRGRLVRATGPVYKDGVQPSGYVVPVEERAYWPDGDSDLIKRGRLREVKRWPSGWPASDSALTTTFAAYDIFGPTIVQDPAGGSMVMTRAGAAGRVSRIDYPDGRYVVTRDYDGNLPRLLLKPGGSVQRFTYDSRGRLLTSQPLSGDPEAPNATVTAGWLETRAYDSAGNMRLVTRSDQFGVVRWKQELEHNYYRDVMKVIHPEPGKGYAYYMRDFPSFPHEYHDEDGERIRFSTAVLPYGRVSGLVFQDQRSESYGTFDYVYQPGADPDRISQVWQVPPGAPASVIAEYGHDDFGRLAWVKSPTAMGPSGKYWYAYDARGNVVQRTGGGSILTYQYDGIDRPTRLHAERLSDASTIEYLYTYDDPVDRSRLHSVVEQDRTTVFTYDEVGRLRFETVHESNVDASLTSEYVYDADGDLEAVISPGGLHVKYTRDPVSKDITAVENVTTGTMFASNVKHLPSGPVTDLTYPGGSTFAQGFNLRYEPIAIASGPVNLSYVMTPGGNVKSIGSTTFEYARGRLKRATPASPPPAGTPTTAYRYTYSGDRITGLWTAEPASLLKVAFGYDDANNLSALTSATTGGTTCLIHDALGRLTAVGPARVPSPTPGDGACNSEADLSSVTVSFRYDARNRRVARRDGSGPWKHWAFSMDGAPLAELWKPSSSSGSWTVAREYVWLEGRPLAQLEYPAPSGGSEGYVYVVHVDHRLQPVALTSTTGTVVWSASPQPPSNPFGEVRETTTPDPANGRTVVTNLRLPGQYDERLLGSLGLQGPYYNWNRWYLPVAGRYLELDPIAVRGEFNTSYGVEWYGYAGQNPLKWTDPTGLTWGESFGMFWDWLTGRGPQQRLFGPGTNQVNDMMMAPGVIKARQLYYQKNAGNFQCGGGASQLMPVTNVRAGFGPGGALRAGFNSTRQFVGNYTVSITPNPDGSATFTLSNTTSMTSFLYGLGPSWNRSTFGPGGNMSQDYTWTE